MCQRHNKEIRFKLLDRFPLLNHRWYHLILRWFPQNHLLAGVRIAEDIVTLESLTLIGDHVTVNTDVTLAFGIDHHGHKLGDLVIFGVVYFVLFLIMGHLPHLL